MDETKNERIAKLHAEMLLNLEIIRAYVEDLPAPESDALTWGAIADAGHVNDLLGEIIEFIK